MIFCQVLSRQILYYLENNLKSVYLILKFSIPDHQYRTRQKTNQQYKGSTHYNI